jgi:hypothetical protein
MTPIAEVRLSIQLDKERALIFNVNTMSAYEQASGNFYWDTMLKLFEFYEKHQADLAPDLPGEKRSQAQMTRMGLEMLRHLSTRDLTALLWAATHEYNGDVPFWPLTQAQVGRYLRPQDTPRILNLIIQGHTSNAPTRSELGEVSGAGPVTDNPAEVARTQAAAGGPASIALPLDAFV